MKVNAFVLEKHIEKAFVSSVCRCGGLALKFISPGRVGVPDRIVFLPGGRIVFAEIKRPGGRLRKSQIAACRELSARGAEISLIQSKEDIQQFCERYFDD